MMTVQRTIDTSTAADTVFAYLIDFAKATEWDAGTVSCDRITTGPIDVGARFRNVSKFLGRETELEYELTRIEPDRQLVFIGRNKTVTSTDTISFTSTGTGTTVTYQAQFEFRGISRFLAPLLSRPLNKLGDGTATQLKATLDRL